MHRTFHPGTRRFHSFRYFTALHFAFLLAPALLTSAMQSAPAQRQPAPAAERTYQNPILFADYSDPDILRDGKDYYLVASSFHFVPGLPILHSRDLVHWEIQGHVLTRLPMSPAYDMRGGSRYGRGVWAPAVRFHDGLFYIYFPTPDEGIFVATAPKMTGPWSAPQAVLAGPGFEDPCPFWDDDGKAYLVHSRLGAGPLILHRMSPDGKRLLDDGKIIVQDREHLPTLEGPKLYKRAGWYYIFAPMGGVGTGDQVVLRSRSIDGPYEWRHVLTQGSTQVNGPHQGGWVQTPEGGNWFVHFQQRGGHGRIVWLEPMVWGDDGWPRMGTAVAANTEKGEPVLSGPMPVASAASTELRRQTSDEFDHSSLSPMWEWNHNPIDARWSLKERPGFLRLHPEFADNLLNARNTLTESMQDESLQVTTRIDVTHMTDGDRTGLSGFERDLTAVGVLQKAGVRAIFLKTTTPELAGPALDKASNDIVQLRVTVRRDMAQYAYSVDDGASFHDLGAPVTLHFSWWKGARPAVFAYNTLADSTGYLDFDWVRYRALPENAGQ